MCVCVCAKIKTQIMREEGKKRDIHLDLIIMIGLKSPGHPRRLTLTQSPWRNQQLTLVLKKILKGKRNISTSTLLGN